MKLLIGALVLAALLLGGCAAQLMFREGTELVDAGEIEKGLALVEEAARLEPRRAEYRAYLIRQREIAVQRLLAQGDSARQQGQWQAAEAAYKKAAVLDPTHGRISVALEALRRDQYIQTVLREAETAFKAGRAAEARKRVSAILTETPQHREAQALLRAIDETTVVSAREPLLSAALRRPITLEFRDTDLKSIFELISRSTAVNFFFDKDVRQDMRTSVFVRNTSIDDVIRFILVTNQLERKVLNENTLLIYPNTPAKVKEYQELLTKSFYLAHADAKLTANMIRNLVKTKDIFVDEKLRLIVLRDTPDAIRMAEKLIAAQDLAQSEVMLEVEVMEVASSLLSELGIRFPDQISYSIVGADGTPGTITLPEWLNRSSNLYRITVTNPLLIINFKDQAGQANLLANPRIRVRDGEKAKIHIGDRVPVITTTLTATSFAAESVSYLDVGLKLEVEPAISLKDEVAIKVGLEVSNIVQEIKSASGSLTYRLGTRNANTVLHLKDGETQILAGLISDEDRKTADRLPGVGALPVVGRLFSSHKDTTSKTEVVLLITPRILRTLARPDVRLTEFMSGTESAIGVPSLTLRSLDKPAPLPQATHPLAPVAAKPGAAPPATTPSSAGPASPAATTPVTARLDWQGPATAQAGAQFTIAVDLVAETPVRAGTFDVAFDFTRLKVVKIEEGDLLKKLGAAATFNSNVQGAAGRLSISYATKEAVTGTANLARITFEVTGVQEGTTVISMTPPSASDPAGNPLRAASPTPLVLSLTR